MIPRSCLMLLANKIFFPLEKVKILRKFSRILYSEAQFWKYSKSQATWQGGGTPQKFFSLHFWMIQDIYKKRKKKMEWGRPPPGWKFPSFFFFWPLPLQNMIRWHCWSPWSRYNDTRQTIQPRCSSGWWHDAHQTQHMGPAYTVGESGTYCNIDIY